MIMCTCTRETPGGETTIQKHLVHTNLASTLKYTGTKFGTCTQEYNTVISVFNCLIKNHNMKTYGRMEAQLQPFSNLTL